MHSSVKICRKETFILSVVDTTSGQDGEQMNLAWLPPTAAGLSLDGGCILSAIALDPEKFPLNAPRPHWSWSTSCCAT